MSRKEISRDPFARDSPVRYSINFGQNKKNNSPTDNLKENEKIDRKTSHY